MIAISHLRNGRSVGREMRLAHAMLSAQRCGEKGPPLLDLAIFRLNMTIDGQIGLEERVERNGVGGRG